MKKMKIELKRLVMNNDLKIFGIEISPVNLMTGAYLLFLCAVSLTANSYLGKVLYPFLKLIPDSDKIIHFTLVGILTFVLNLNFKNKKIRFLSNKWLLGSLIAFGVVTLEEFSQLFLEHRSFTIADLFANYCGILIFEKLSLMKFSTNFHKPKCN